jgi:hypothetical protein
MPRLPEKEGGNMRVVSWFSAGASSAVATKIAIDQLGCREIYYNDIEDHHPDNKRFISKCEKWFGIPVVTMLSPYKNVANVIRATRWISGPGGASCSRILKKRVRKDWEAQFPLEKLTYVWGLDYHEKDRAEGFRKSMPYQDHVFPLIENQINKEWAHFIMLNNANIQLPEMYRLGFPNNNCIGCVRGGQGYWNLIRKHFPDVFASRAKLEREIGASCINGTYLDELPLNAGRNNPIVPECDMVCEISNLEMKGVKIDGI